MNTQFSQTAVLISQHIYNAVRRSVIPGGNLDSASAAGRMDNLSVSNVHGHMVDCASAVCIENQIARPHLGRFDRSSLSGLLSGGSGQGNSCHMAVNIFDKTGAVRSCVGIVAAPYIPVSYKLETILFLRDWFPSSGLNLTASGRAYRTST